MSKATDLIVQIEQEQGCRVDSNDGDNNAVSALLGTLARALGQSEHAPKDDVAAGILIQHRCSPEYRRQRAADELMADLLAAGMSPDDIKKWMG